MPIYAHSKFTQSWRFYSGVEKGISGRKTLLWPGGFSFLNEDTPEQSLRNWQAVRFVFFSVPRFT